MHVGFSRILMLVFMLSLCAACSSSTITAIGDGDAVADGDTSEQDTDNDTDASVDGDDTITDGDTTEAGDREADRPTVDGDQTDGDTVPDGDGGDLAPDGDSESDVDSATDGDTDGPIPDGDLDTTEADDDAEAEAEEELDCVRGERYCMCLPNDECLNAEDICRDGECEYCSKGEHYCPCLGITCLYDMICSEGICLKEDEIDGDEEIVCPGGMDCDCYPDETCQEGLECRLGTVCMEPCEPFHAGEWGCPCVGGEGFCYEIGTKCVQGVCIPNEWADGDR